MVTHIARVYTTGINTRPPPQCYVCESEKKRVHGDMTGTANCQLEGAKWVYNYYIYGIYRGFNRQRLESRGMLEDEGTKMNTTYQVLNIIQNVSEIAIHLKVDEEPQVAWTCIFRGFGLQMSCCLSLVFRFSPPIVSFPFLSSCFFKESTALRSISVDTHLPRQPQLYPTTFCVLFLFLWSFCFFRVFL